MMVIRPARPDDETFLRLLHAQCDEDRLFLFGLEESEMRSILTMQFEAHRTHYKNVDWEKSHCVVEVEGKPVGQFIILQDEHEVRLAEIMIARDHRGQGIGVSIIQGIQNECVQSKRPLRLHVEKTNPAVAFYQRLGFELLEDRTTHFFVEWVPPNLRATTTHFFGGQQQGDPVPD